ncbi:MAG: type II toxin-antitoxin system RelE/ParE family toxin [Burkholderiales bacterium]|jgi:hypothetical protein
MATLKSAWEVEFTQEFESWWSNCSQAEQISIAASVRLLEVQGPSLGYPYSSSIRGAKLRHLRELRTQHQGRPLRTLYAFDPRRTAVLLLGGDKTADARWYQVWVPRAEALYAAHIEQLRKKGLANG